MHSRARNCRKKALNMDPEHIQHHTHAGTSHKTSQLPVRTRYFHRAHVNQGIAIMCLGNTLCTFLANGLTIAKYGMGSPQKFWVICSEGLNVQTACCFTQFA